MKREHTQMMTSGPITRQLIRFSVPLVLGNLFQLFLVKNKPVQQGQRRSCGDRNL